MFPTDHPLNMGIVGMFGHPKANTAVKRCDSLMVLGSSLVPSQTGPKFAKPEGQLTECAPEWLDELRALDCGIPDSGSYAFNRLMTSMLPEGTCITIDGGGTALYTGFQSSVIKEGSRLVCSTAISAMGSGLPEAVGACLANGKRLTTCLIGDGSLMLNLQELQTIATLNLPIKIFVLNNSGYLAIRHTLDEHFDGRMCGVGEPDIQLPRVSDLAAAFNLRYSRMREPYQAEAIQRVLDHAGPDLVEVITPNDQKIVNCFSGG